MSAHWVEGIILVLALIMAAMSAAAETALTALNPAAVHVLEERGGVGRIIAYLRSDPNRFLSTILIISSTSLIVASSMATLLAHDLLLPPWSEIAVTVGLSIVVLIVAELTPKNIAVRQPRGVAVVLALMLLAPPVALADSAGDQQYIDPLAGNTTPTASHPPPTAPAPVASAPESSTPAPAGSSAPAASAPAQTTSDPAPPSSAATATTAAASQPTLPFTGLNVWMCAAVGVGMLGAGLALRRLARPH